MPRPKGLPKTGGRKPGVQNRDVPQVNAAAAKYGMTPKEYLLRVMRDPKATQERRDWAASTVATFVYPRLQAVESKVDQFTSVEMRVTRAELAAEAKRRIDEAFKEYSPPQTIDMIPPPADQKPTLPEPPLPEPPAHEPEPERPPREYAREGKLAAAPEVARLPTHYRRPRPVGSGWGA